MSYSVHHQYAPWPSPAESAVEYSESLSQIEPSIGPSRVATRSHRKQSAQRPSLRPSSRPGTPSQSLTIPASLPIMTTTTNTTYPLTPESSTYSPYSSYHSRSNSTSNPRSASPALSTVTSGSTNSPAHHQGVLSPLTRNDYSPVASPSHPAEPLSVSQPPARPKQRKQRLFNVDRKKICDYHDKNPHARQEDIAAMYGVERSTISKILKHKAKWQHVPENETIKIAKHRPSKWPEIESIMLDWLSEPDSNRDRTKLLTDTILREKALSIAREYDITEDRFKASSGWVENFKHRHGVRNGIYGGYGRNAMKARALGCGVEGLEDIIAMQKENPAKFEETFNTRYDDDDDLLYSPVTSTSQHDFDHHTTHSLGHRQQFTTSVQRQTYRRSSWTGSADDPGPMDDDIEMDTHHARPSQSSSTSYSHRVHSHYDQQYPNNTSSQPYSRNVYEQTDQPPSSSSTTQLSYSSQVYASQPPALPTLNTNLPLSQQSPSASSAPIQQSTPVDAPIHRQPMTFSEAPHPSPPSEDLLPPLSPSGRRMVPQIAVLPGAEGTNPDRPPPTLADAEMAINRVILYVDTVGRDLLTAEQRDHLHEIKCVLFQAGAGIPYR